MSTEITKAHSQQYATNVALLLQQKQSRIRPAVMSDSYTGKAAQIVQQVGSVTLVDHVRHADTPILNTPHDVRWLQPISKEGGQYIDKQDFLRMVANPLSGYVQTGAAAANRAIDQEIIRAYFGTALTGEDMGTSVVWDTFTAANATHLIDSAGATNMTVSKLRLAKKALMTANVDIDNDPLFCIINASMHDSLLGETLAASVDYNSNGGGRPVLEEGRIRSFMGFNFIHTELIPTRASTKHSAMAFAMSGVALGIFGDVMGRVDELPGKSYTTQVYTSLTIGASRIQEKCCTEIVCAD
jgi:hypothetical protein